MPTTTTGIATEFITFSRPGATGGGATVTDSDGRIKWAAHNLLSNSESLESASWTRSGLSSVSANNTGAPNGTTTAEKLLEDTSVGSTHFVSQVVGAGGGQIYSLSCFAKSAERTNIALQIATTGGTVTRFGANFDLSAGTVSKTDSTSSPLNTFSSINPVGGGWYLCTVGMTTISTATDLYCYAALSDSNNPTFGSGSPVYTGVSGYGAFFWGAHVYRSDLGGMQPNTSAYSMYNPTTPKNLLGYTEDFSNAAWTKNSIVAFGSGSTTNAVVAPNGLQTADLLVEAAAAAGHGVFQTAANQVNSTFSFYAKAAGRNFVALRLYNTTDDWVTHVFDLSSGTRTQTSAGSASTYSAVSSSIQAASNGFYRISLSSVRASGTTYYAIDFCNSGTPTLVSVTGAQSYTGDGTSGIYLWGAQLSDSASLDPYVPVYGAAVTSAAYYGPRRDFDGATLACKGLLVEEQRSNLLTYSEAFDDTIWLKGVGYNSTVSSNTSVAPSGATTADSVIADSGGGTGSVILARSVAVTSGTSYTLTFFAKAGTLSWIRLFGLGYTSPGNGGAYFNLSGAGAVGTVDSGYTASIAAFASGWYRCSLSFTAGSSVTGELRLLLANANNDIAVARNGTSSVLVWGAQLEANASFATSYIPTGAATATRNADVASVSTQAFPYGQTEGTLVANVVAAVGSYGAYMSDGTANNYILTRSASSGVAASIVAGGMLQANIGTSALSGKIAVAYKLNDFAVSVNGGAASTATSGSVPTGITQLRLGAAHDGGANINGWVRQITYLPRRISNTELQTRTA